MSLIVQSDLENVFGSENVVRWSQLDPDLTTVDTTRVSSSITYAEAVANDILRGGRYAVPLSSTTATLTDALAKLAGVWLYTSRGSQDPGDIPEGRFAGAKAEALTWLHKVRAGSIRPDLPLAQGPQSTAPGVW